MLEPAAEKGAAAAFQAEWGDSNHIQHGEEFSRGRVYNST